MAFNIIDLCDYEEKCWATGKFNSKCDCTYCSHKYECNGYEGEKEMKENTRKTIMVDVKEFLETEEKEFRSTVQEIIDEFDGTDEIDMAATNLADMCKAAEARMYLLHELGLITKEEAKKKSINFIKIVEEMLLTPQKKPDIKASIDSEGFDWNMGDYVIHIRCEERK